MGKSDESVFHDCKEDAEGNSSFFFLKSPPELFPAVPPSLAIPQPSKVQRDAYSQSYLQRPLPELPVETSNRVLRRLSAASAISTTPSITPSLLEYADDASLNLEDIEVGIAQLVHITPSGLTPNVIQNEEIDPAEYSISDYETSPKSARDSFLGENLSPGRYLPMTGSGLERGMALFTSPKPSIFSRSSGFRQSLPSNLGMGRNLERLERSIPTETHRSPLLHRARVAPNTVQETSSPHKDKGGGKQLFAGLRNKTIASPRKLVGMALGLDVSKTSGGGNAVQRAMGNWI